jgi:hypothetical protein
MSEHQKLVAEITEFMRRSGVPATNLSIMVSSERGLVARILAGGDCTLTTADKLRRAMRDHGSKKKPSARKLDHRVSA